MKLDDQYIFWEALAKPVFAGWECWVTLGEAGMRRKDAPKLLAILGYLGVTKPSFVRESKYIRLARRAGHKYPQVEALWTPKGHMGIYWRLGHLFNRMVDEKTYMSMPMDLRAYFRPSKRRIWNGTDVTDYYLAWNFPIYELVIKVKKSYNTFIGHLYGDKIGEYEKLYEWLYGGRTYSERSNLHGSVRYASWESKKRGNIVSGYRNRWHAATREMCREHDEEALVALERKYKLFTHKKFNYK